MAVCTTRAVSSCAKQLFTRLCNSSRRSNQMFLTEQCCKQSRSFGQLPTQARFSSDRERKSRFSAGFAVGTVAFSRGLLMLLGLGKKEEEDPVISLFREARLAQHEKNFDKAEYYFHEALKVAAENHRKTDMTTRDYLYAKTNIFDSLADMALSRGQFDKAEKLYKETMKCCFEVGVDKDDNSVIEISIKLASIYAMQHRDAEARTGFEFCIKTQEQKVNELDDTDKDTVALLGLALESYGRYLMYQKQLDKALPLIERAVTVATSALGEEHPQTLVLHNDLATLNILRKNYGPAEKTLKYAIEVGERVESSEVPALYCNLGALYMRKSELEAAKKACSHALQLAKKMKDTTSAHQAQKCLDKIHKVTRRSKSS
ncbi:tetratricopeptide repeat protein 19, mitochondrial-like [Haliotis asinina]|uniref:tetratricopeptide repeat protein 19, mitochondrial-like n=1 Tax=Haliotis asinina TaxID=109174 RepID=UPI003531BF52